MLIKKQEIFRKPPDDMPLIFFFQNNSTKLHPCQVIRIYIHVFVSQRFLVLVSSIKAVHRTVFVCVLNVNKGTHGLDGSMPVGVIRPSRDLGPSWAGRVSCRFVIPTRRRNTVHVNTTYPQSIGEGATMHMIKAYLDQWRQMLVYLCQYQHVSIGIYEPICGEQLLSKHLIFLLTGFRKSRGIN